ncbi:MAG TPA: SDR family oxidoreductase [Gammaproteobacteria bacterium]|nr:SDR family oxidoreductase [Gammaproteobacteria bacterium]
MSRVLVTGANGFVGRELCKLLEHRGYEVRVALRELMPDDELSAYEQVATGELGALSHFIDRWKNALDNVDSVIHLAARVHVMKETSANPLAQFRAVNTEAPVCLAKQAAAQGVKRFIYVSSIKVNGEATAGGAFCADDRPEPGDAYAVSKAEAEAQLLEAGLDSSMQVVCVRPPLIYGPGVRGNFLRLIKLVEKGLPLPLAMIKNNRSMVSVGNMTDLLECCITHPQAAGEIFLVSDGVSLSTPELISRLADCMGVPARLFPVPRPLLKLAGKLIGQSSAISRLCDSLEVDISKTREHLGWQPPQSVEAGIRAAVEGFTGSKK